MTKQRYRPDFLDWFAQYERTTRVNDALYDIVYWLYHHGHLKAQEYGQAGELVSAFRYSKYHLMTDHLAPSPPKKQSLPRLNLRVGESYPDVLALWRAYGQWRTIRAIPDPALRVSMAMLLSEYLLVAEDYWEYHRSERMKRYLRRLLTRVQQGIKQGG